MCSFRSLAGTTSEHPSCSHGTLTVSAILIAKRFRIGFFLSMSQRQLGHVVTLPVHAAHSVWPFAHWLMVPVINSMHTGHSISFMSAPTPSAVTRLRLAEPADDVDAMA
eukprot:CAMPEP_0182863188 /NCGR_PEP_ID=MMETSP0034_2-20130328/6499_1 /TAXON_ID=156128 /ORGANISM="Nephroselmis pyriformis, Strain CCMP717" /LENGTH=108 /DNA_ID=CAMNT_0024995359 /DNA_START=603 /DNA_END=926 /DNA_ORIENTATION=-